MSAADLVGNLDLAQYLPAEYACRAHGVGLGLPEGAVVVPTVVPRDSLLLSLVVGRVTIEPRDKYLP